ncbi:hypothetical protein, partial [Streptomyces sp. NPDC127040]|uniref:hypothetical protein n=1 Tax=Streptomyces sp. NPDC127040 TaxID=3347116 RepID=UPI0036590C1A
MSTKPLAPHGTYGRANGSPGRRPPCYCEPCVIVKRKTRKRSKVNRELGRSAFTTIDAARAHITLLHQTMSWSSLTKSTGLDCRALTLIYAGRRTRITRTTEAKILAVQPPEDIDLWVYVDSTGTVRRLRALMAIGHSGRAISETVRTNEAQIHRAATSGQPYVRRHFAIRVEKAYRQMAFKPPTVNRFTTKSRNLAAAKGWHGPLAWDDATIDDPAAQPDIDEPYTPPAKNGRDSMRMAELEHLLSLGESET